MKHYNLILSSVLLIGTNIYSANEFGDEFEDEPIKIVETKKESKKPYSAYGSISLSSSYNYAHKKPETGKNDFRGVSSAKVYTNINLEYEFNKKYKLKSTIKAYKDFIYDIRDDNYLQIPKDYDQDGDINEFYLQRKDDNIDIRVGRQIVIWGKSDNIRITDTLNPMDNRTPGMVDIEDLRLGRFMSKVDYYLGNWSLSGIILHENRFTENPRYGSDFRPVPDIDIDKPSNNIENQGVALSLNANFSGYDIAFYYSNQYLDKTYTENNKLKYNRSNMFGFAYTKVIDTFLLKTELAYFDKVRYSSTIEPKKRLDVLVGVEYKGISDTTISLEIANRHIYDYEKSLYGQADNYTNKDETQYALRYTQSFINQTLDFTILYTLFGKDLKDGGFVRGWFDYDIDDKLSASLGVINYIGGDKPNWENIKNNDKIFTSLKYSF